MHASTVFLVAASLALFEHASFLPSKQMFFSCHMVRIPHADMAAGEGVQR